MFKEQNLLLDTSALVECPTIFDILENKNIYLTIEVLEELDNHKTRKDNVGKSARQVNRFLDQLRERQSLIHGAVHNTNKIFVLNFNGYIDESLLEKTYDNRIISAALKLKETMHQSRETFAVLSNDIAFRLKCDSFGINAHLIQNEKYHKTSIDSFDIEEIFISRDEMDSYYKEGKIYLPGEELSKNKQVLLRCEGGSALGIADENECVRKLMFAGGKGFEVEGIRPRNAEQVFAFEALLNPDIHLVTMTGIAGSGKTLLAISAAIHGLHSQQYNKIIVSRPVESTSKDIGYLPGTKEEKLQPWVQPIFDNLEVIFSKKNKFYIQKYIQDGKLEVEALTFIRGRTLPNTIFILDEAQNINYDEAKAILTRMGENSKLILIGDLEQIDSKELNQSNSGLASTIEIFKSFGKATHITLKKGERSELAAFAAKNM
jgi:PhoH-like ATPase